MIGGVAALGVIGAITVSQGGGSKADPKVHIRLLMLDSPLAASDLTKERNIAAIVYFACSARHRMQSMAYTYLCLPASGM